jgi:hypothetical protein
MPPPRLLGFPHWFWRALLAAVLVVAAIALQPWRDPLELVVDVPQLAEEYLKTQHASPDAAPPRLPFLAGLLNQLGVLAFCTSGVVCLFAARLLDGRCGRSSLTGFLTGAGLLSVTLAIDDLFMIHETVHGRLGGRTAKLFTVAYATALLGLLWSNRRELVRSTEWRVLLVGLACFGTSEVIANLRVLNECRLHWRIWDPSPGRKLCEESLKWIGAVMWFAYLLSTSSRVLSVSRDAGSSERSASA